MKTGEYGLYELPSSCKATKHFRFGNHPIRMAELAREYGVVSLMEVSRDREAVKAEARRLNSSLTGERSP
ncbi:hypothetical protein [Noviherbaspirillum saxi]|uniref:hypothetical protein n=1 Tax=Noviherbaspirillum saxi TaxID=2320863 RepID=UPI0011C3B313|nr:hypothetical protein [Noviherbaspirillum saxi]